MDPHVFRTAGPVLPDTSFASSKAIRWLWKSKGHIDQHYFETALPVQEPRNLQEPSNHASQIRRGIHFTHWPWWILLLFIFVAGAVLIPPFVLWKSDMIAGEDMTLAVILIVLITAIFGFFGRLAVTAARRSRVFP